MNALESLVLRVRETEYPVSQLRISAPDTLLYRLIDEFEARGQAPEFGSEKDTGCDVVWFGPHLPVHADNDLPDDTFMIQALDELRKLGLP